MEIYISYLHQILSFSSHFRRLEMKNFLCRHTMVSDNISLFVAFFSIFFVITRVIAERHVLLRDLYFICILIDTTRSEVLTFIFQSDIMKIWAHIKLSPFYYKANGLNQLALTLPVFTVCLLHLPNPTTSHRVSSVRLPKCIRNEECFIFFYKRLGEE